MRDALGGIYYLRAHLEEALITDGRVAEGGLRVAVEGDHLVVSGTVSTDARRQSVDTIAVEVAGDVPVRNATSVVSLERPSPGEALE
jgi:hypothetical protein